MNLPASTFWTWFRGFAGRIPRDDIPDELQDELLSHLHCYDDRLYFLLAINTTPHELIVTADGNADAFASADALISVAPKFDDWKFFSLKPPLGFDFRHTDGPISVDVSDLWFMPTQSSDAPPELGVILYFPDANFVIERQSVDTAYTILETAIGERAVTQDIARVTVDDRPDSPAENGCLELARLPEYIAFHKRRHNTG